MNDYYYLECSQGEERGGAMMRRADDESRARRAATARKTRDPEL